MISGKDFDTNGLQEGGYIVTPQQPWLDGITGENGTVKQFVAGVRGDGYSIEAQLHSRNAGDIWNIGDFPMKADASRTKGRRTIKAHETNEKPLGEWNRYRIRLDRGDLTLEVNGLVQNQATDCREIPGRIGLQSEGAHIEFRTVALRPIVGWKPLDHGSR